ncbi:hypothetical protein [Nonomuraea sp. NPDC050783]|uniref:hypothetical protein n=1 Tax=Nonomuraea sp. NPDC050783 TaxID=3154634 RepID=UPI0034672F8A
MTTSAWIRRAAACALLLALGSVPAPSALAGDGGSVNAATVVRTPQLMILADGDSGTKRPL